MRWPSICNIFSVPCSTLEESDSDTATIGDDGDDNDEDGNDAT